MHTDQATGLSSIASRSSRLGRGRGIHVQLLLKGMQYVTFQTANIPLTQGYKVSLRQLGYALNVYDWGLVHLLDL